MATSISDDDRAYTRSATQLGARHRGPVAARPPARCGWCSPSPGKSGVLHRTWLAFFLSFVVWFNFAPFSETIREQLHLTKAQMLTLSLCNVALTVPARLFIGMALDRFGPRRTFSSILIYAAVPCTMFATAQDFNALVLSRLLRRCRRRRLRGRHPHGVRVVPAQGAGHRRGRSTAAGATSAPPSPPWPCRSSPRVVGGARRLALGLRRRRAWSPRSTASCTSATVQDTPDGVTYSRPARQGALEVTSRSGVFGLAALTVPLFAVLGVIAARIWSAGVISHPGPGARASWSIAALLVSQLVAVFRVNGPALRNDYGPTDQYPMKSVAALCFAYFCTFGSELAVVSMLPTFFTETWGLGAEAAGFAAGSFAFFNIVTRPGGGLLSDLLGSRRRTLVAMLGGLTAGFVLMATLGSALARGARRRGVERAARSSVRPATAPSTPSCRWSRSGSAARCRAWPAPTATSAPCSS